MGRLVICNPNYGGGGTGAAARALAAALGAAGHSVAAAPPGGDAVAAAALRPDVVLGEHAGVGVAAAVARATGAALVVVCSPAEPYDGPRAAAGADLVLFTSGPQLEFARPRLGARAAAVLGPAGAQGAAVAALERLFAARGAPAGVTTAAAADPAWAPPRRAALPPGAAAPPGGAPPARAAKAARAAPAAPPPPPLPAPPRRDAPRVTEAMLRPDPGDRRPRVALVADVPGWAFDVNERALAAALGADFWFAHLYVSDLPSHGGSKPWPDLRAYDAVFLPYAGWDLRPSKVPWDRALGSLRSAWFNPDVPAPPGPAEFALVNRFRAYHVVTQRNYDEIAAACPRAVYLTNPVDTGHFDGRRAPGEEATAPGARLVAAWSGNARHQSAQDADVKGFHRVVAPAAAAAGVKLEVAEYNTRRVGHAEMPAFFRRAHVALCASLYEGASNSVMEAMAMGLAVVATDVGNHAELRASQLAHQGETGIELVPRDARAFAEALKRLARDPARARRMGVVNRTEIAARWSWGAWRDRYAAFVRAGLRPAAARGVAAAAAAAAAAEGRR